MDAEQKVEPVSNLYVELPRFYEAFLEEIEGFETAAAAVFIKCQKGKNPVYSEKLGWRDWSQGAKKKDVLKWFAKLIEFFLNAAKEVTSAPKVRRWLFAQLDQAWKRATADRNLDIGFVNDPKATHWSQVLVTGELKCNPEVDRDSEILLDLGRYIGEVFAAQDTRRFVLGFTLCGSFMQLWKFDRLGAISSLPFDINQNGHQLVSATLRYLWVSKEHLGFDPTIFGFKNKRYIEITRNGQKERLILK